MAVDNTPGDSATMVAFLEKFPYPISYLPLGDNKGIGEAQNIGIRANISHKCSHVLLLDQDSALPPGIVKKLIVAESELLKAGKKIAAVGPQYMKKQVSHPSPSIIAT